MWLAVSAASTVNDVLPGAVGVPLNTPAVESASPGGSIPDDTVHVIAPVPPLAVMVWL